MKPDLSARATFVASTGAARVVFLWNPASPDEMGQAGLSVDAGGLNAIQMMELSTSLGAFSRSIAYAAAEHVGLKGSEVEDAWKEALLMIDAPDHETKTRTMAVSVKGGAS